MKILVQEMLMKIQARRLVTCKQKIRRTVLHLFHTHKSDIPNRTTKCTKSSRHAQHTHLHGISQRRLRLLQRRVRGGDGARHLAMRLERAETRLVIGAEILSARAHAHAHKPIHASNIFMKICRNMIERSRNKKVHVLKTHQRVAQNWLRQHYLKGWMDGDVVCQKT
jgi:hypothetical protein